jgi:hypothetical protein
VLLYNNYNKGRSAIRTSFHEQLSDLNTQMGEICVAVITASSNLALRISTALARSLAA